MQNLTRGQSAMNKCKKSAKPQIGHFLTHSPQGSGTIEEEGAESMEEPEVRKGHRQYHLDMTGPLSLHYRFIVSVVTCTRPT